MMYTTSSAYNDDADNEHSDADCDKDEGHDRKFAGERERKVERKKDEGAAGANNGNNKGRRKERQEAGMMLRATAGTERLQRQNC